MSDKDISILSIAPYTILPANTGGRLGIAKFHHYLGQQVPNHLVSTVGNADNPFSFTLHKLFPDKAFRYLPNYGLQKISDLAKKHGCTHIICEHPYMAITAISLSKKLGIPWYMHTHNIESYRFRTLGKKWWPLLARYEQYGMHKARGIFFVTKEDADYAVKKYGIAAEKCHVIPYGCDHAGIPPVQVNAKQMLAAQYNLDPSVPWLYFLGILDYQPNADAVAYILDELKPRIDKSGTKCEVLIAGKGLNENLISKVNASAHVHYLGFVPDLSDFLHACDIMLNPVITGGGIKTKAVEALAYNKIVVSSHSGAAGIEPTVCGNNLFISPDYDWDAFAGHIISAIQTEARIPESFYHTYYWGNVAQKAINIIKSGD